MIGLLLLFSLAHAASYSAWELKYQTPIEEKYQLPDPVIATLLSSQIGFGAGHFYAKRPAIGTTHFLSQGIGICLTGYGMAEFGIGMGRTFQSLKLETSSLDSLKTDEPITLSPVTIDSDLMARGAVLATTGLSIYLIDHLIDTLTAPASARRTDMAIMEKLGI